MDTAVTVDRNTSSPNSADTRLRTAHRVFRGALMFNTALTAFWLFAVLTHRTGGFFGQYEIGRDVLGRIAGGILFFYVVWGFVWYGIKSLLLKHFVGFTKDERRQAFSSRMREPFEVSALTSRYSERRIRIVDMIGRRGRFITLAAAGFFYLYARVSVDPSPGFATLFLQDNLLDAVITSWVFLAFFYAEGTLAAAFYGPQSRIMDGVLARANCLLITTLWTGFKFVMVPLGSKLSVVFPPEQFAIVFALIWGSYIASDALAEIGGSLFGKQKLRVWGIGDINRKSVEGTLAGFAASLGLCVWVALGNHFPWPWLVLAVVISLSNTLLELFSPRGTDDLVMATGNALLCWGFAAIVY